MSSLCVTVVKPGGETLEFHDSAISELTYVLSTSFDGDTVQADEITAVLRLDTPDWLSLWSGVNRTCPVLLDTTGRNEKYFFKSIRRVGKSEFELSAQSPIARLASDFSGGIYDGTPLPDVLAAILRDIVSYSVNPLLESVRVYGHAPYQSRRETLHALALAYGFLIRRDENQNLFFTVPDTSPYAIPDNAIFTEINF